MWASISLIREWETDPKAFFRSRNVTASGELCVRAFWMMADMAKMCSMVPLVSVTKPFWRLVSRRPFLRR